VVTDLDGKVVEGTLRPSSDLETHTLLYREFPAIGGVVHTPLGVCDHSLRRRGWRFRHWGTTHATHSNGPVPCTAPLTDEAIGGRYVHETGVAIVRRFAATAERAATDPLGVPGCLVAGHGPFAWGRERSRGGRTMR